MQLKRYFNVKEIEIINKFQRIQMRLWRQKQAKKAKLAKQSQEGDKE
jgi:hypothetical protein